MDGIKYIKICAGDDGVSYFSDEKWPLVEGAFTPPSPAGYFVSDALSAQETLMMHHPDGYLDEWHRAPAPVLGTVLRGDIIISTSDGDSRRLSPGDQFVAADLTGDGHKMEGVNAQAYDLVLVVLDDIPGEKDGG